MTSSAGITRISHSNRAGTGLTEWEAMDPATLEAGAPVQRGWMAFENSETGYMAGVWDCTAFIAHAGPYEVDEFMFLLDGSVTMALPDGSETTVSAGEAFVIPKGFQCQWKQSDYVRKIFMIVDDPVPEGPANPSLQRITVPDLAAPRGDGPVEQSATWFTNGTGQMSVSVRTSAGGLANASAASVHAILHVLEGQITLASDGMTESFEAGQSAYIHAGSTVSRDVAPGTRWIEASYTP